MSFTSNIVTGPYKTIQTGNNLGAHSGVQNYGLHTIGNIIYQIVINVYPNELGVASPNVRDQVQHLGARLAAFKSIDEGQSWTFVAFGPYIRTYHHGFTPGGGNWSPDNTFYHDYMTSVVDGDNIKVFYTDGNVLSAELIYGVLCCATFDGTQFVVNGTSNFNPFPIAPYMFGWTEFGVTDTLTDRWYDYSVGQRFTKVGGGGTIPFLYIDLDEHEGCINAAKKSDGKFLVTFWHKFTQLDTKKYAYYSEFDGSQFTAPAKIEPTDASLGGSKIETLLSDLPNNRIYGTYRRISPDPNEKRYLVQFQGDALTLSSLQFFGNGGFSVEGVNLTFVDNGQFFVIREFTGNGQGPQLRYFNLGTIPLTGFSPVNSVPGTLSSIPTGTFVDGIVCKSGSCFVAFAYIRIGSSSMGLYRAQSNPGGGWFTWQNIVNFSSATSRSGVTWEKHATKVISSCNINPPATLNVVAGNGPTLPTGIDFASLDIITHPTCGSNPAVADQMFMFDSIAISVQTVAGPPPVTGVPSGCPDIEVNSAYCQSIKVVDDSSPSEVSCADPIYTEDGSQPC